MSIVPVTLLSGFLGSGKTTLLKHILSNKQNLKCAVLVNDMAELNIDGMLVEGLVQKKEDMVTMQNGCICCTLRGDLLVEIRKLVEKEKWDVLVIESTGISEPMQVAETFGMQKEELEELQEQLNTDTKYQSLEDVAKLDTCVTLVDVSQLLDYFDSGDFIAQRFEGVEEGDERTVVDLLCDQIEFANVIILSKTDLVPPQTVEKCRDLINRLNPDAKILPANFGQVDLKEVLLTGTFDYEKAALSPGWLKSLREPLNPETVEYGISSFVYRRRKPFHPKRLHDLLSSCFLTIENQEGPEEEEEEEEDGDAMEEEQEEEQEEEEADDDLRDHCAQLLAKKKKSVFKSLLRSKGFCWIATRPKSIGEWSQAGMMLTLTNGGNWFCELPEEMWPDSEEMRKGIRADFDEKVGDKRQELVLIGQFTSEQKQQITEALDKCLVTKKEWKQCQKCQFENWEDPWEPWMFDDVEQEEQLDR